MAGRSIVIEFLGRDVSAGSAAQAVEQKFGKLGGRLDQVGQAAGKLLAVGLVAGGVAMVKMTKAAAEDDLAQQKLANSLRQAAGASDEQVASTEAWITAQGKALGITDDELRPALAKLATATGDVGKAQEMVALAMDISAGSGKSLESVSAALAKAQTGSVAGLSRLGVATKDAAGNTKTLSAITGDLATKYKDSAATAADTMAGKQKILSTQFGELQEQIGAKLLPVMTQLAEVGLKVVDWVSRNTTTVGVLLGVVTTLAAGLWATSVAMRAMANVSAAWSAITKVAAAAQWLLNAAMTANPIGIVIVAIAALVAGLIIAYKKSETFRNIVNGAFAAVANAAQAAFNWIKDHWRLLAAILLGPFGIAVGLITKHWDTIKDGARAVKDFIVDRFDALVGFFRELPGRFTAAASSLFDGIKSSFRNAINWIIDRWNGLSFSIPSIDTHIPGVGKVGGFTLSTPDIPHLASGGIVRARPGGTMAVLGEGGRDEAVIPLGRGAGGGPDLIGELRAIRAAIDRMPDAYAQKLNGAIAHGQRSAW